MENTETDRLEIKILPGGPAVIKGDFTVIGPDGKPFVPDQTQKHSGVAFCRCGRSDNQPFCDGSHGKP